MNWNGVLLNSLFLLHCFETMLAGAGRPRSSIPSHYRTKDGVGTTDRWVNHHRFRHPYHRMRARSNKFRRKGNNRRSTSPHPYRLRVRADEFRRQGSDHQLRGIPRRQRRRQKLRKRYYMVKDYGEYPSSSPHHDSPYQAEEDENDDEHFDQSQNHGSDTEEEDDSEEDDGYGGDDNNNNYMVYHNHLESPSEGHDDVEAVTEESPSSTQNPGTESMQDLKDAIPTLPPQFVGGPIDFVIIPVVVLGILIPAGVIILIITTAAAEAFITRSFHDSYFSLDTLIAHWKNMKTNLLGLPKSM